MTFIQTGVASPQRFAAYGFWDGGRTFKIRAAFPPNTSWNWATTCALRTGSTISCTGLTQSGEPISVGRVLASEKLAICRQGLLKAPAGSRFLTYFDGTSKFFWLGETAWAAPILGTDAEWHTYVADRGRQDPTIGSTSGVPAFSVVQMGVAPLWGDMTAHINDTDQTNDLPKDRSGRVPFEPVANCTPTTPNAPNDCMRWRPDFFGGFDARVEATNQQGLVVLVAGLMEPLDETDNMTYFPALAEAQVFARNLVARLAGNHVIYSPGNDTRLAGSNLVSLAKGVGAAILDAHCNLNASGGCSTLRQLITYLPLDALRGLRLYLRGLRALRVGVRGGQGLPAQPGHPRRRLAPQLPARHCAGPSLGPADAPPSPALRAGELGAAGAAASLDQEPGNAGRPAQ